MWTVKNIVWCLVSYIARGIVFETLSKHSDVGKSVSQKPAFCIILE